MVRIGKPIRAKLLPLSQWAVGRVVEILADGSGVYVSLDRFGSERYFFSFVEFGKNWEAL